MIRRIVTLFTLALIMAVLVVGLHGSTVARADGIATVTPQEGTVDDLFTFSVSGLTPANTVRVSITDSSGHTYQLIDRNGNFLVLVVQPDGTAVDMLTPSVDTPDATPGQWTAKFEEIETGASVTIAFMVDG